MHYFVRCPCDDFGNISGNTMLQRTGSCTSDFLKDLNNTEYPNNLYFAGDL
jgi:hypothetical protein